MMAAAVLFICTCNFAHIVFFAAGLEIDYQCIEAGLGRPRGHVYGQKPFPSMPHCLLYL